MPILKANNLLCHFAHIPKCGGTSVEVYCQTVGISTAFLDWQYKQEIGSEPWNSSSPQHVDGYSLSRLFPPAFFDFHFAITRHPLTRLISAFQHQTSAAGKISSDINLSDFITLELYSITERAGAFDNHFLPQTRFFIPNQAYKMFKIENGLDRVKNFLDTQFFGALTTTSIGHENRVSRATPRDSRRLDLNKTAKSIVREIYSRDFELLRYDSRL
jgi:hypothetical protein